MGWGYTDHGTYNLLVNAYYPLTVVCVRSGALQHARGRRLPQLRLHVHQGLAYVRLSRHVDTKKNDSGWCRRGHKHNNEKSDGSIIRGTDRPLQRNLHRYTDTRKHTHTLDRLSRLDYPTQQVSPASSGEGGRRCRDLAESWPKTCRLVLKSFSMRVL